MSSQSADELLLIHFGKKGMKWGQRKSRAPVKVSSDYKKTAPHRGKKVHQLTDKQLKDVNARMNLEQNYRRLNPSKVQRGEAAAKNVLRTAGVAVSLAALVNSHGGRLAIAAGKKAVQSSSLRKTSVSVARRVLHPTLG